jgi:predicted RNA-binding Zn-ribbon protein involved in translation (DUF1610 family)
MTENLFAAGLGSIAILSALALNVLVRRAGQKRVRSSLTAKTCPDCGKIFSDEALHTLAEVRYHWTLSPGKTVSSMSLPHWTFQIICAHCHAENEYGENGRVFMHPQTGVIGFTRTIKSKTGTSLKFPPPTGPKAKPRAKASHAFPTF